MTRALSLTLVLLLSLSSAGAEQENGTAKKDKAAARAAESADRPPDSPLAAAAKRTGRLGKKPDFVITNETIKASSGKGHVTTTTLQHPLPRQPEPPARTPESEWDALQKKAEAERTAAAARAAAKEREEMRIQALAAEAAEDGYLDDFAEDPAAAEKRLMELEQAARAQEKPQP